MAVRILFTLAILSAFLGIYAHAQSTLIDEEEEEICECPNECLCSSTIIQCTANNEKKIPDELKTCIWKDILTLNISETTLEEIRYDDLSGFPNLDKLYVYNNNISYIDPNAFNGVSSLTLLSLDGNGISHLDVNVFNNLTKLRTLLLYSNQISFLPNEIFDDLESLLILSLHENKLTDVDQRLFYKLTNLQRLYIHNNLIADISNSPFVSLSRLALLYLSGNNLEVLNNASFAGLSNLQLLMLRSNRISGIGFGTFAHTTNLRQLYMDYNRIEGIYDGMLSPMNILQILTLAGNRINLIEDGSFTNSHYLQTIYLQGNRLENLTASTFRGLFNLRELVLYRNYLRNLQADFLVQSAYLTKLWLQQNRISCLNKNAFRGLVNLELLHLSQNEISYLPSEIFSNKPKLLYLILSYNNLKEITSRPFRNLSRLVQLALFYNAITYISDGSFDGTNRLSYLQWNAVLNFNQDNRLVCNCSAMWLQDYILENRPYYASVYCGGPDDVSGTTGLLLSSVSFPTLYNCSRDMSLSVTPSSPVIYVQEGSCLTLQCRSSKTDVITWSRLEQAIDSPTISGGCDEVKTIDSCGNSDISGLLTIPVVSPEHEGTYVCSSVYDNKTVVESRRIAIGNPPVILKSPQSLRFREPPSYLIFEASADGFPQPKLKWYHNSIEIDFTESSKMYLTVTGSLIIIDPVKQHSGEYKFAAVNEAGIAEVTATLEIYFESSCNRGQGCYNNGSCVPFYYCVCQDGFSGDGCENSDDTNPEPISPPPTDPPDDYSGDYYYSSGDYYYSGDYVYSGDYSNELVKKRSIDFQYNYDFADISSQKLRRLKSKQRIKYHRKKKRSRIMGSNRIDPIISPPLSMNNPLDDVAYKPIDVFDFPKDIHIPLSPADLKIMKS